jgi:hypothetical protein
MHGFSYKMDLVAQLHVGKSTGTGAELQRAILDCIVTPENARALPRMRRDENVVFCFLCISVSQNMVFKAVLHLPREK